GREFFVDTHGGVGDCLKLPCINKVATYGKAVNRGGGIVISRRKFMQRAVTAGVAVEAVAHDSPVQAQPPGRVRGYDHVALPMQNTDRMLAFYRSLGFPINEGPQACSVYVGDQMINFHRPVLW